jgi:hypothetical protein
VSVSDVSVATSKWPEANESSLAAGRDLFIGNCNGCHRYPDVEAVPEQRWPRTMRRMAKKAHLGPEEEQKILRFVLTARARASR